MDATVVCIDQTKKSVQVEPRATWFPRGTRPAVELSGQRDWTCLLGAITEDGDRFFSRFEEYVTADDMWDGQGTAFKVVEEGWHNGEKGTRRLREREVETLETILEVADSLADEFGVEPPQEPTLTIEGEKVTPL